MVGENGSMKCILFSIFLFLGLTASSQGDSASVISQKYERLRVCMVLIDTTAYPCPITSNQELSMYKFQIKHIFEGVSEEKTIKVCAAKEDILQFNPLKEPGKEYWWVLLKEGEVNGIPLYRHSGNF